MVLELAAIFLNPRPAAINCKKFRTKRGRETLYPADGRESPKQQDPGKTTNFMTKLKTPAENPVTSANESEATAVESKPTGAGTSRLNRLLLAGAVLFLAWFAFTAVHLAQEVLTTMTKVGDCWMTGH
jgi:hypothetical protein